MKFLSVIPFVAALFCFSNRSLADESLQVRKGVVRFEPSPNEIQAVPERFRMPAATFEFTETPQPGWTGNVKMSLVTFPSPVHTPHENNNTVHCEFYRPAEPGKYPACVVLHILGGDFPLARLFAHQLASKGVAAMFLKMPYYGERRQPGAGARMISSNPEETVRGMTQAVKDIRYAAAWLAAQKEVDSAQLGVFGISLGGITASLATAAEPRFNKCCPVLAGGDMAQVLRSSNERHLAAARKQWAAQGRSLDELDELIKAVDPCTYEKSLAGRTVLMLNARNDEVIPRACTESLWEAFGRPPIHWYNAGHYSALLYIADALEKVTNFFANADGTKRQAG
ncbi:MAG: alpha/beta hydrolase family protein [Pirellulales bacterium]|nr:alpha/beta hydrolase family protein [Pirellulales bacterium]